MTIPEQSVEEAFLAYRKTRDASALAVVYDGTSSRLLAVALHLASSANAAEDAVQDTFLFALEHPERWDETRPLVPWLLGILVNRLRQSAYRANRTPDPGRIAQPDVPDPSSELQASELLKRIDDAITHLPQPYRTVVLLRLRNGLEPADIAVALDRKPSTVRAQLTRGVEMLRKVLPAGVAGLILGTLALPRGLTAAREIVLKRAAEVQRAAEMQAPIAAFKAWGIGGSALLLAAALFWAFALGDVEPSPSLLDDEPFESQEATRSEVRELPLPQPQPRAAPESERTDAAGAVLVRVVRRGRTMPFAPVEVEPLGDPPSAFVHRSSTTRGSWQDIVPARANPPERVRNAVAGDDGVVEFGGLTAGFWVARALGVCRVFEVRAGQRGELQILVEPASRLVNGLVVDGAGEPIAGARVWTCQEHRSRVRRFATRCDEAGRFQLAVAPSTTVGASAPGLAPVAIAVERLADMPPLDVRMVLRKPGARVEGQVVDAQGLPVAGAVVQIGVTRDAKVRAWPKSPTVVARARRVVTDREGRFAADGLVPGAALVATFHPSAGACTRIAQLVPAGGEPLQLQTAGCGSVRGVIRDGAGRPVAGAVVRVGRRGALDHRSCLSDGDGSFELDGIPAGRVLVEASDHRDGFASTVVEVTAGGVQEWSPTFGPDDLVLRGRLVSTGGQGYVAWVVHRGRTGTSVRRTDADGRFALRVSEREAALDHSVFVFLEDPRRADGKLRWPPFTGRRDLRLGDEVVIEVPQRRDYRGPRLQERDGSELPVHMAILWPDGVAGVEPVELEVYDADGERLHRSTYRGGPLGAEGPYVLLRPGRHRIAARTASGLSASVTVDFSPASPQLRAVLLPLR